MRTTFFRRPKVMLRACDEDARAYRDRVIASAEGEAARFEALLLEYEKAPEVTRDRLYIEAVEEVYGNSNKVILDSQGSGNLLYLPIDKLIENRGPTYPSRPTQRDSRTGRIISNHHRTRGRITIRASGGRDDEWRKIWIRSIRWPCIVVVVGLSLFTVNERELAIKLRVGEVVGSDYEPGLAWKMA